ncbi:MAG: glycosyltransferase family 4 protein [Vicinamibacterales bacterium]
MTPLRLALVAPVATSVPPARSGSIETMTALLADGLVARGHQVTLFAVGTSTTAAALHALFPIGYRDGATEWPWELCELLNLSAAMARAGEFDVVHCQSEAYPMSLAFDRLVATPVLHTLHYAPAPEELALWARCPEAPFVALSAYQAARMAGVNVVAVVPHGLDLPRFPFRAAPDDYLLFLGRFTEGKGVVPAIEAARRAGLRITLAAEENAYYRERVAPLVDGRQVEYVGEVGPAAKAALLGGARALLYPVSDPEPFGLVLAEAMGCGTPVAALDAGAVAELVVDGVTGGVFATLDQLVDGLPRVLALDRARIRAEAERRFDLSRMIARYEDVYRQLAGARAGATERRP